MKIYERRDALLHAKTAVIDGVWSTIGSKGERGPAAREDDRKGRKDDDRKKDRDK